LAAILEINAVLCTAFQKPSGYPTVNASTFALIFAIQPLGSSCVSENQNPEQATLFL
jgi:hypothetical protein